MLIRFFFIDTFISLAERKRLKSFLEKLFKVNKKKLQSLIFIFCTDAYLLEINKQYLQHDFYTDIITFNLAEGTTIAGEIYISIDRIRENAQTNKVLLKEELHRIIFHGALHLCGFKDKRPPDKKLMTAEEDKYLRKYFK